MKYNNDKECDSMILLFDIGNTNIVLGVVENDVITNTFRFVTDINLTEDDYYQKIHVALSNTLSDNKIEGSIISSVVPGLDQVFMRLVKKFFGVNSKFIGPGLKSGLVIKLENPKQMGADLLCDGVGAYTKYGGPVIIIDMGTATKLIVVNGKKEFLGGAICAGLKGSLESLITTTSKLSRTSLIVPDKAINNETSLCIQSGIVLGHIAMIEGMVKRFKKELGTDNVKVILTGGYSTVIKEHLDLDVILDENVLLEGLYSIYKKNNN